MGRNDNIFSLQEQVAALLGDAQLDSRVVLGELTIEVDPARIVEVGLILRDQAGFAQLTDLCGIDYSQYGQSGDDITNSYAEGGAEPYAGRAWQGERFAVVYHLLSFDRNIRLRMRAQLAEESLVVDSVIEVWPGANWFEREAFDLFGIIFNGHPDLRRLLTDYGFIGHPFRKDFPLSGQVEMRYDEEQGRVIYQPVTIEPRTLVPRTIRKDIFAPTHSAEAEQQTAEQPAGDSA